MHYGPFIGHIEGQPYHDFPEPAALTGSKVEAHLRELGFGYRAKYISQTALKVANERPLGWLDTLRNPESPVFGKKADSAGDMRPEGRDGYREAHGALLELQGCGPKVADCVCLMGLGWGEAVPVDTHGMSPFKYQKHVLIRYQSGKSLRKTTNLGKASTVALRRRPMTQSPTISASCGERKLVGLIAYSSQPTSELSPIDSQRRLK